MDQATTTSPGADSDVPKFTGQTLYQMFASSMRDNEPRVLEQYEFVDIGRTVPPDKKRCVLVNDVKHGRLVLLAQLPRVEVNTHYASVREAQWLYQGREQRFRDLTVYKRRDWDGILVGVTFEGRAYILAVWDAQNFKLGTVTPKTN